MSTHSPGPWEFESQEYAIFDKNEGQCVATFASDNLPTLADGRLMAAAPDLLKACRPLLAFLHCGCGYESCGLCHAINQAESAIKKARGEQ